MAMNAYRNYTNNVAAMKKNLEKLSSGYKINRAGETAAVYASPAETLNASVFRPRVPSSRLMPLKLEELPPLTLALMRLILSPLAVWASRLPLLALS